MGDTRSLDNGSDCLPPEVKLKFYVPRKPYIEEGAKIYVGIFNMFQLTYL